MYKPFPAKTEASFVEAMDAIMKGERAAPANWGGVYITLNKFTNKVMKHRCNGKMSEYNPKKEHMTADWVILPSILKPVSIRHGSNALSVRLSTIVDANDHTTPMSWLYVDGGVNKTARSVFVGGSVDNCVRDRALIKLLEDPDRYTRSRTMAKISAANRHEAYSIEISKDVMDLKGDVILVNPSADALMLTLDGIIRSLDKTGGVRIFIDVDNLKSNHNELSKISSIACNEVSNSRYFIYSFVDECSMS